MLTDMPSNFSEKPQGGLITGQAGGILGMTLFICA